MIRFHEWLEAKDPYLYEELTTEGQTLRKVGRAAGTGARNLALAGLMGIAAMGGVDQVAKASGNELPEKLALDDELGDQGEELEDERRRKLRNRIKQGTLASGKYDKGKRRGSTPPDTVFPVSLPQAPKRKRVRKKRPS